MYYEVMHLQPIQPERYRADGGRLSGKFSRMQPNRVQNWYKGFLYPMVRLFRNRIWSREFYLVPMLSPVPGHLANL